VAGPRVCFVTCRTWPEISASDQIVARALERRGATVTGLAWNDPAETHVDDFDLVVLRSNWDYHLEPERFSAWLDARERAQTNLWNPVPLVRWNLSKEYLLDLAARGVPVVPTEILHGPAARLSAVMDRRGWHDVIVKPCISASANDTRRVHAANLGALEAEITRDASARRLMVQPFVHEIARGEWSCVFIDGALTHTVLKTPADDDYRVQAQFGGRSEAAAAPASVIDAARRALRALPSAPLYARVDGVETSSGFVLMEMEVNEPGLFFVQAPAGAARFADAILRRVAR
jgi:glutathione synthase/RimK-type ligase-like ATP-grasp enzyme